VRLDQPYVDRIAVLAAEEFFDCPLMASLLNRNGIPPEERKPDLPAEWSRQREMLGFSSH